GMFQGLGPGYLVAGIARLESNGFGCPEHGQIVLAQGGQGPAPQPMGTGIAWLELDRLFRVVQAEFRTNVDIRFGAEHEGFRSDRFENNMCNLLHGLARIRDRLKGEEYSSFRIRLPENLAQLVGNQYGLNLGQFQLLGDLSGREAAFKTDDQ